MSKSREFINHLLDDIFVLNAMIRDGKFQKSTPHLGAEQEIYILDQDCHVSLTNQKILHKLNDEHFDTELAKFNIEINLDPILLQDKVLSQFERQLLQHFKIMEEVMAKEKTMPFMSGLLPTIRYMDLDLDNITPKKRYFELVKEISKQRGKSYELRIQGEDELSFRHDSVFIESMACAFQIHLEIHPDDFAKYYNISQLIAAPVLGIAANSSLLLRKKLWHESRIALLRQSIDTSSTPNITRDNFSRVSFGNSWVKNGVLDLFREDISLHKILLKPEIDENSIQQYHKGHIPELKALRNYNSTIYRWNRPVYGVYQGKPHLRIENRMLPAGPTIVDQVANTAFWTGLMLGFGEQDIDFQNLSFSKIKSNFIMAARNSFNGKYYWLDGKYYELQDLILTQLMDIAYKGLAKAGINAQDAKNYLSIIEQRAIQKTNGALWQYQAVHNLSNTDTLTSNIYQSIVRQSLVYQKQNKPLHKWDPLIKPLKMNKNIEHYTVEESMERDIFTVRANDSIQMAADIIDWQTIRYVLVEDKKGHLVGLISSRNILKAYNNHLNHEEDIPTEIQEIMVQNVMTIESTATMNEALDMMKKYKIGCLPVLQKNKLVGIVTEKTFMTLFAHLIDDEKR